MEQKNTDFGACYHDENLMFESGFEMRIEQSDSEILKCLEESFNRHQIILKTKSEV